MAANGMIITKHDPSDENKIEVSILNRMFDSVLINLHFLQLLMQVPIRQISYTGADIKDKKLFAFISNDVQTKSMLCHIFKTKSGV